MKDCEDELEFQSPKLELNHCYKFIVCFILFLKYPFAVFKVCVRPQHIPLLYSAVWMTGGQPWLSCVCLRMCFLSSVDWRSRSKRETGVSHLKTVWEAPPRLHMTSIKLTGPAWLPALLPMHPVATAAAAVVTMLVVTPAEESHGPRRVFQ